MYIFIMGYDDNDIQNDIHDWNFGKGRGTRDGRVPRVSVKTHLK